MYRYNEPSVGQYESFFNPIPLEFVQQNLQQHQGKYDVGFGEALAAKDMYSSAEVSENDIANKNNIVSKFTNNMDEMVKEKYGGDWGRASKEVARMVTNVRQNPFWDTAKILKERQEEARKLKTQYGSEALVFDDLMGRGSIDPETGKVISPDQLQYDIRKRGDWAGSIDDILSRIKPDTNIWGLSEADFGYLRSGKTTQISSEGIKKIAEDKGVQQAILSANPDMREAFERLPQEREKWFGDNYESVGKAVEGLIKGRGRSMVFKQEDDQFYQEWLLRERMDAAAKTENNPYYASANQSVVIANIDGELKEHERQSRGFDPSDNFDPTPWIDPETGRNYNTEAMLNAYDAWSKDKGYEKNVNQRQEKYYNQLVEKHPELRQFETKEEAFKAYGDWIKSRSEETRLNWNLKLEDSPDNIKRQLFSNINSGNFKALTFVSTGDVFDKNSITKKLGYTDYTELQEALKDQDISPVVDFREGKIAINIPNKSKKRNIKPETVYFDPDVQTKSVLNVGQYITERFYDANTYGENERPIRIPDGRGGFTSDGIVIEGEGDIVSGNKKRIWLIDLDDKDGTKPPIQISIEDVQKTLTEYVDRSFNNYQGKLGNPGKE